MKVCWKRFALGVGVHIGMEGHGSEEGGQTEWARLQERMALYMPAMVPQHSKKSNLVEDIFYHPTYRGAITINKNCEAGL